jgi:NitT/TauT family transport system ATP-binding protein
MSDPAPPGAMITLSGVSRRFRRADGQTVSAVHEVSLSVPEGQFVCIVGPSGCGKSTLLQLVAGLLQPSSGRVAVAGAVVKGPGPDRGVVFQKDSVFPWMRVRHNVEYGLRCRGVASAERSDIARRYLGMVGLAQWGHSWPRELSGGMLKRVAIATVFANGARVLLLDEPFGALDYVTKRQLHEVLLTLWEETGTGRRRTVLFVTHDVDEALLLADRVLVMHSGRVVDDILVTAPRPRDSDSLLLTDMIDRKHALLAHLGLEARRAGHRQKLVGDADATAGAVR